MFISLNKTQPDGKTVLGGGQHSTTQKETRRKAYAVRHRNRSLCTQKQPGVTTPRTMHNMGGGVGGGGAQTHHAHKAQYHAAGRAW